MLIAYCDGGCNNKTHKDAYGSFALRIVDIQGESDNIAHETYVLNNCKTSNEAEYETLIALLTWLVEHNLSKKESGEKEIIVYSDSKLMVNQVNGGWKISAENLIPKRNKVMSLLKQLNNIKLLWTPRKFIVEVLGH